MNFDALLANDNVRLDDILRRVRRCQTHELNQTRFIHGEYHTLFQDIKKYPEKFKEYTRMSLSTFQLILGLIEDKLQKNWCYLHQPIRAEEQLVVTLMYVSIYQFILVLYVFIF